MKVFKFGGASVKDADAVRNVARILRNFDEEPIIVVVSAMGKTTNALEEIVSAWYDESGDIENKLTKVLDFHQLILADLFPDPQSPVYARYEAWISQLEAYLSGNPSGNYDFDYDQLVSLGELISTTLVQEYLVQDGLNADWMDVRGFIRTDGSWREGRVDWPVTLELIQAALLPDKNEQTARIAVTQGFLGSTAGGDTTTLGREGSDYSAAILSYALNASEMVIWKDVPGLLNADPKYFSKTQRLASISYREAIELSYYGATIIHPKTIKPLQNKDIPLWIKSFVNPLSEGSLIHRNTSADSLIPSFIFKVNQVLISVSPLDFSFIDELNLSDILAVFARNSVHISLMQNSAISFSVCVDDNERRLRLLFAELGKSFKIRYNTGLDLITIRHWDQATIDRVMEDGKTVLLEMRSRQTAQFVVRPD